MMCCRDLSKEVCVLTLSKEVCILTLSKEVWILTWISSGCVARPVCVRGGPTGLGLGEKKLSHFHRVASSASLELSFRAPSTHARTHYKDGRRSSRNHSRLWRCQDDGRVWPHARLGDPRWLCLGRQDGLCRKRRDLGRQDRRRTHQRVRLLALSLQ